MNNRYISALLAITVFTSILFSISAVAADLQPDPDGTWDGYADWGLAFTWENAANGVTQHADAGVGLQDTYDPYVQKFMTGLPGAFNPYFIFEDNGPYLIVVDNVRPDETYVYDLKFDTGSGSPSNGLLKWTVGEGGDWHVPNDFLAVIDNINGGGFGPEPDINLRAEDNHRFSEADTANVVYENAVNLSISPDSAEGYAGDNVSFNITVSNTGRYDDNYLLSSTLGYLSPSSLAIPSEGNDSATLDLTLPVGTEEFTVTAAGDYASDNSKATAFGSPFSVSLTPNENGALPGENVGFKIKIHNLSDKIDNYSLSAKDDAGWNLEPADNLLENVSPDEEITTLIYASIPDNENLAGVEDNITVTVKSERYAWAEDNENCIARAGFFDVGVSISPDYQENSPGGELSYIVEVSNTGTIDDTFDLSLTDNISGSAYWEDNLSLDDSSLTVQAGEKDVTTLNVLIPEEASPGITNIITVSAASETDSTVEGSDNCSIHVSRLSVSISPDWQSGMPGEEITYVVELVNNENASRYYYSALSDNLGWASSFDIGDITISPYGVVLSYLHVQVPENVRGGTEDNVTLSMISENDGFSYSDSCTSHAEIVRGVEVSITPLTDNGPQGSVVEYTVNVKNTGNVDDTYDLSASDDAGWGLEFADSSLTVPFRGTESTTLSVSIPENAGFNVSDNVTVRATSQSENTIWSENSCTCVCSLVESMLHLNAGWNLVSFPVVNEGTTKVSLFENTGVAPKDVTISTGVPLNVVGSDVVLQDNLGYYIHTPSAVDITFSGIPVSQENIDLNAGWNLISLPVVDENTTKNNLFEGSGVDPLNVTMLENIPLGTIFGDAPLHENRGYCVYTPSAVTITCP